MKQLFSICILFALVSCSSNDTASSKDKRSIATSKDVVSFQGEFSDEFTQIVFTCDRFGLKSKLAAAYFNQKAEEKNSSYRASAKSLNMTASTPKLIQKKVVNAYRKKGLNIKNPAVVGFRTKDIDKFESIIMLDAFDRYGTHEKFVDWTAIESGTGTEDLGLENIKAKIDALILSY